MPQRTHFPGILLAMLIGLGGYFGSAYTPAWLNGILLALLLGMVVGNLLKLPAVVQPGIGFTSSKLLELSVLFLAFSINYGHITRLGASSFSIVLIMVLGMVFITYHLARQVRCPGSTGWLVGFGTAICGSSAIAALAPRVAKNKDDVGIAMAVVNLFGSVGMVVLPLVLVRFDLSDTQLGILIGGTLHSVGNVVGAGYTISDGVGEAATTIKLARVAMLSPALILFNLLVDRDESQGWRQQLRLPWYLWGFIGITLLTSVVTLPAELLRAVDVAGKLALTIALAAIGLKVSFGELLASGRKGLGFGLIVFAVQFALVAGLMVLVG
ncbi:MAG: putative sulfate exporter family transporter [Flavobacteriales bacterium]|nr:putative sulfate exporter family transporter [Flavobacteriales bacterium]